MRRRHARAWLAAPALALSVASTTGLIASPPQSSSSTSAIASGSAPQTQQSPQTPKTSPQAPPPPQTPPRPPVTPPPGGTTTQPPSSTLPPLPRAMPRPLEQQQAPRSEPVTLPLRVGVGGEPEESLTLQDAIRLTLEQNNDVAVARLELEAAREDVRAAEGVFDPRLTPTLSYERSNNPNASAIGGATEGRVETNELIGGVGLAGRSPWQGGLFSVDFTSSRLETSNNFSRLNPQFPSLLSFSFTQPLLRGRGFDQQRRQILLSKRAADLTDAQLRTVVMAQLTLVEQAYWDLVFASRNLDVQRTALEQARGQVASNERQVVAGTLAPVDVVEAQTQVATFEQTVASAQQALTEAENTVKSLMLTDRHAPLWNRALVPSQLVDRPLPPMSLDESMKLALSRRPEVTGSDISLAQNDIDRRFFENQTLPQVDVTGGYSLQGLAGLPLQQSGNPLNENDAAFLARLNELSLLAGLTALEPITGGGSTVPSFFDGSYGQSLSNLFRRRFPTALIQVSMDLPLRNRTAKANLARTRVVRTQLDRQRRQLEQAIEAEVRNTLQAVQTSDRRLAAAASARRNAQEQYDSERRRFDSGLSTVFLVLERQTALVTAQASELRARADLNQAIAAFHRAIGGTLEQHGVQFQKKTE